MRSADRKINRRERVWNVHDLVSKKESVGRNAKQPDPHNRADQCRGVRRHSLPLLGHMLP